MTDELKPCPFCGGEARIVNVAMVGCAYVVCTDCRMQSDDGNIDSVVTAWNTRADAAGAKLAKVTEDRDDALIALASARKQLERYIAEAEAALPAVYRLALVDAEFACTNVIKNYDVTYDGGKKFAPMKTQNAAKGMVSIAREDILALPTPTAAELIARIQTGENK